MKRYVPKFEEFLSDYDIKNLKKLVGHGGQEKKKKNKVYLGVDTQNPKFYGDDEETATAKYPSGGL